MFTPISSFRQALATRSSLVQRSRRHALLSTREGQNLARHTLSEVVAYVRYCHEHDDDPLTPRDQRILADLEALSTPSQDAAVSNPKPLLGGLRTARFLMKHNDLWLGHNDPKRRLIISALGELGFHLPDYSLSSDPEAPEEVEL